IYEDRRDRGVPRRAAAASRRRRHRDRRRGDPHDRGGGPRGPPPRSREADPRVLGGGPRRDHPPLAPYGVSALGAFGVLAILERGGDRFATLQDFRGLSRRRPLLAWLLVFFLLSFGGIPPPRGLPAQER